MSLIGTPFVAAHELLVLLVEWAENTSVSTPTMQKAFLIQFPIIAGLACVNGFLDVRNTSVEELSSATCSAFLSMYRWRTITGHNSLLSLNVAWNALLGVPGRFSN